MSFDKKLVEMEEEEPEETDFSYFLKRQILPLLRTLLMTESRSSEEDDDIEGQNPPFCHHCKSIAAPPPRHFSQLVQ